MVSLMSLNKTVSVSTRELFLGKYLWISSGSGWISNTISIVALEKNLGLKNVGLLWASMYLHASFTMLFIFCEFLGMSKFCCKSF